MELYLENVRCFCGKHSIPVRPLTLLVGENSSGKSTFLAMLAHVGQPELPSIRPAFNVAPFDLGNFDSIATFKRGRYPAVDSFSVGYGESSSEGKSTLVATYANFRGQPRLSKFVSTGAAGTIRFEINPKTLPGTIPLHTKP